MSRPTSFSFQSVCAHEIVKIEGEPAEHGEESTTRVEVTVEPAPDLPEELVGLPLPHARLYQVGIDTKKITAGFVLPAGDTGTASASLSAGSVCPITTRSA